MTEQQRTTAGPWKDLSEPERERRRAAARAIAAGFLPALEVERMTRSRRAIYLATLDEAGLMHQATIAAVHHGAPVWAVILAWVSEVGTPAPVRRDQAA